MQGLCRIFASNPTQFKTRIISEIRRKCRVLCRVCKDFLLLIYIWRATRLQEKTGHEKPHMKSSTPFLIRSLTLLYRSEADTGLDVRCVCPISGRHYFKKTKKCTLCLNPAHYTPIFATYAQKWCFSLKMNMLGRLTKVFV